MDEWNPPWSSGLGRASITEGGRTTRRTTFVRYAVSNFWLKTELTHLEEGHRYLRPNNLPMSCGNQTGLQSTPPMIFAALPRLRRLPLFPTLQLTSRFRLCIHTANHPLLHPPQPIRRLQLRQKRVSSLAQHPTYLHLACPEVDH